MAFEQLGLNLIVQGVNTFVSDINRVNTSLMRYVSSMKNYETAMLKYADANRRMADQRIMLSYRLLEQDRRTYDQLNANVDKYALKTEAAFNKVSAIIAAGGTPTGPQKGQITKNVNLLFDAVTKLEPANERLILSQERLNNFINMGVQANRDYNAIANKSVSIWGLLGDTLGMVTKGFGNNVIQGTALGKVFLTLVPELAGFTFVLDALKIGFDGVVWGIKLFMGTAQLLWNIVKKVLSVFADFAKILLTQVWNGIKTVANALFNLATAPFRWIYEGLQNIWKAIGNIIQIVIGMSFDRILWGVGQRLREITEQALEAGSAFQLMQIRLTGLIQREMSETGVMPFSESLATATVRAKELSNWISKLGVTSIFSTSQIANVMTLAMSYDYTEEQSKELTTAIVKFATAMGLGDQEMVRIVENMGQMKAAGKMTGQELRDLARGAFVPTARVFQVMADMEEKAGNGMMQYKVKAEYAKKTQAELNKLVKDGVQVYEAIGKKTVDWMELRELGRTGDIPVDKFMKAFIEMTNRDFPNAIENAKSSMQVLTSNIKDFIDSFIGWRVVTPILDVISQRMNKIMAVLISDTTRTKFETIGKSLAGIFENVMNFFDQKGPDITSAITRVIDGITLISQVAAEVIKGNFESAINLVYPKAETAFGKQLPVTMPFIRDMLNPYNFLGDYGSLYLNNLSGPATSIRDFLNPYNLYGSSNEYEVTKGNVTSLSDTFRKSLASVITFIKDHQKDIQLFLEDPIGWIRDNGIPIIQKLAKDGYEFLKTKAEEALGYIGTWWQNNGGGIILSLQTLLQSTLTDISNFVASKFGKDNPLYAFLDVVKSLVAYFGAAATPGQGILPNSNPLEWTVTPYSNFTKGDSLAKATDTLSKSFDNLKTSIKNLLEEGWKELGKWIETNVPGWSALNLFWEKIQTALEIITPYTKEFLQWAGSKSTGDNFKSFVDSFATFIATIAGDAAINGAKTIGPLLGDLGKFLDAVGKVGEGIGKVEKFFSSILNLVKIITEKPESATKESWFGRLSDAFKDILKSIEDITNPKSQESPLSGAETNIGVFTDDVLKEFMDMKDELVTHSLVPETMSGIYDVVTTGIDKLNGVLPYKIDTIVYWFENMKNRLVTYSIVPEMMSGIYDSMIGTMDAINLVLPGKIDSMIAQFQRGINKIDEYIRKVAEAGVVVQKGGGGGGGGGGGTSGTGSKIYNYDAGGSFRIPPGFENDTWNLGGGHFAKSGELITITPASMIRNISNSEVNNNYNLSVSSAQPVRSIITQYELIKALT